MCAPPESPAESRIPGEPREHVEDSDASDSDGRLQSAGQSGRKSMACAGQAALVPVKDEATAGTASAAKSQRQGNVAADVANRAGDGDGGADRGDEGFQTFFCKKVTPSGLLLSQRRKDLKAALPTATPPVKVSIQSVTSHGMRQKNKYLRFQCKCICSAACPVIVVAKWQVSGPNPNYMEAKARGSHASGSAPCGGALWNAAELAVVQNHTGSKKKVKTAELRGAFKAAGVKRRCTDEQLRNSCQATQLGQQRRHG